MIDHFRRNSDSIPTGMVRVSPASAVTFDGHKYDFRLSFRNDDGYFSYELPSGVTSGSPVFDARKVVEMLRTAADRIERGL